MKTPQQKSDEEQRSSHSPDRSPKEKKKTTKVVSFPSEIIEDILSRLPVKSILRSTSVSKPWLSLISHPSFTKLHFTRSTTTHRRPGFFISAYDYETKQCHYLIAGNEGGALTKLMTVDDGVAPMDISGPSHLNGFMCFTSRTYSSTPPLRINSHAYLLNPATRRVFHLPDMNSPTDEYALSGYLYGFDESVNDHKILLIKYVYETEATEFMIYSLSSFSWRKIDAEPPFVGFDWERLGGGFRGVVCLNSVVHLMLNDMSFDILAFDFVKEKFSFISLPQGFLPEDHGEENEEGFREVYMPCITKINGCLAVVLHDWERSEVRICVLQDYQKHVWVNETIKFPKSWNDLVGGVPPTIDVNMDDEIVFCLAKRTENVITIPVYNMKTNCFRSVQFTLDDQFASSKTLSFCHISGYLETIMPLVDNWSKTSHGESD